MPRGIKTYGANAETHEVPLTGERDLEIDLTGVFVATLVVEAKIDGVWEIQPIRKNDGTIVQTMTAVGKYRVAAIWPGATAVRTRVSAYTSGAPAVNIKTL